MLLAHAGQMEKLRFGVIGFGGMAEALAQRLQQFDDATVVAAADTNPDRKVAADALHATFYTDYEQMLRQEELDAVVIGTPCGLHLEPTLAAAQAGLHIFLEKPMEISVERCDRMNRAAQEAGVKLMVGQVLRLFPLFQKSLDILASGEIGKPRAIAATRFGYAPIFHSGWRVKKELAGGMLLETNVHELDYMRAVMGEPKQVYARTLNLLGKMEYEDVAYLVIEFQNGGIGDLEASLSAAVGEYRVHIICEGGAIAHGGFGGTLRWARFGEEPQVVTVEEAQQQYPDPYTRELRSFVDWVLHDQPPLFTGWDGRQAVAMCEAAYLSHERGVPVAVP
ncbi:MAG: Gfo/Idh/MocA family oxidoreductase [Armatimonadota bacterium]|nr:Gfo/Idh/MocA family oxidoreductase [bacterium]MCS7308724.1 Gfo/Idh/MocA family oxidoreductase [Armatimonadota bacterium]MDW8103651.1 Gfo/Idh/MocA family oxidoreductase [Armatimonadota bacterium]MDW8289721.1 Gfo/Idh/MocA family oxidoreductase [Armatimonadota bacterium]